MTSFDKTHPAVGEAAAPVLQGDDAAAGAALPTTMSKKKKAKITALVIALIILALLFAWYLLNRKPLSELPGLNQTKLPHYERSMYGTTQPLGVAANASSDRVYVTESGGTRLVRVYDAKGKAVGTLKPPKSSKGHLPIYVAINPTTQDVYVSDRFAASIYIYDAKGKYLRTFTPKEKAVGKWAPLGLAFAEDGSLYVTDVGGKTAKTHRVLLFGPDGTLVRSLGTPGQLNFPNGIVVDSHGNIEVSDSNNGRLVVFNTAGKILATISPGVGEGDLGLPRGAAVDENGRLFVADTADHMVRVYTIDKSKATPTFVGSFGGEGQLDATFEYPNGVATDKRAHIYVTDRENNRVQVWGY